MRLYRVRLVYKYPIVLTILLSVHSTSTGNTSICIIIAGPPLNESSAGRSLLVIEFRALWLKISEKVQQSQINF